MSKRDGHKNGKLNNYLPDGSDLIDEEISVEEFQTALGLWAESVRADREQRAYLRRLGWLMLAVLWLFQVAVSIDGWITYRVAALRVWWRSWFRMPQNGHNGA